MSAFHQTAAVLPRPDRRRFVQGLVAGAGLWSAGLPARAAPHAAMASQVLTDPHLQLEIGTRLLTLAERPAPAVLVNGQLPAPILRWQEGQHVHIRVHNRLPVDTSIHWHGLLVPTEMDGVPGMSFSGIAPGEHHDYHFQLRQSGTYWYHGHSGMQEQLGLYGALIIDPQRPSPHRWDREHVILLSDWTEQAPERILDRLRKEGHYYNHQRETLGDLARDLRGQDRREAWRERLAWGRMRMERTDLSDVTAAAYTYLVNGQTPRSNWTGLFRPGETVLLRLINGAAMTYFDLRIPGLTMTVIAADGQPVEPVQVEEIRLAAAETYDVLVTPDQDRAYTLFAQNMDRSGFARGTLAPRPGMQAAVPALDPRPLLTMRDMGHDHHDHAFHQASAPAPDSHTGHPGPAAPASMPTHHDEGVIDGVAGQAPAEPHPAEPHDEADGHHHGPALTAAGPSVPPILAGPVEIPAALHDHPGVDMLVHTPTAQLDDPGVGLRDRPHRVLTYEALRSAFSDPDGRPPQRHILLQLTGHMSRYVWSVDGVPFEDADPILLQRGERVRVVVVNHTMMAHPIHLHGLWSDLEDEQGRFLVRKHTLNIPPGTRRSYRVTADTPGRWAWHCHLMLHMATGMFREFRVLSGEVRP